MSDSGKMDLARQGANVVGALFQVLAGYGGVSLLGLDVGRVSNENSTLVVPASYAFTIWGPIFLLCLAYAVYQALPANRGNPLLRHVGWFTAGAFVCNGVWEILFPSRQFLLAQVVILGIFAGVAFAYLRLVRDARSSQGGLAATERWLVALPLGLLFGWITAATLVSFATTFVALGLLAGGTGEAILGVVLLLMGGVLASAVILRSGPPQGYLAYAAAVLWALAGVVLNQYDASILTTGAALVAAVLVATSLVKRLPGDRVEGRPAEAGITT